MLSSECFSAYSPVKAGAKQKCLAHLQRDLKALKSSRFRDNQQFSSDVDQVLEMARGYYRDYQTGKLSGAELAQKRPMVEELLQNILNNPPAKGWPSDSQRLAHRRFATLAGVVYVYELPTSQTG
ncbi:MAG: hypothetical protein F6K47_23690 [Symploca sp. SIO2E6]|nr:hypothetical protein [Symploca sp. SIO2E6]